MKKIILKTALLFCFLTMVVSNLSLPVMASDKKDDSRIQLESDYPNQNLIEDQVAINNFINMQDKITAVLKISNGKYSYDYNEVKSIIDDFDFTEINKAIGSDYTNASYLREAINSINTSVPESPIKTRRAICGWNLTTEGWNYQKVFADYNESEYNAATYRDFSTILKTGGVISGAATALVPPLAAIMVAASRLGAAYYDMLSNTTERINKESNCGTVTTVNKFVFTWTVKNQKGYDY